MLDMAREERQDLLTFLRTLTPSQWDTPSLCAGWRVREVVAHMLSYDELTTRALAGRFLRGRFSLTRINALGVSYNKLEPEQLLTQLSEHLSPRGLTAGLGGMIAFLDATIHHQDIRRPLGLPREIPADRLRRALRAALFAPPTGAPWRARGLKLVATDVDWSTGFGPEVRGTGEAVLLAIAGRGAAARELTGSGQATLAARCTG
jgi:uncharacterized protein (TIGR03083 family)